MNAYSKIASTSCRVSAMERERKLQANGKAKKYRFDSQSPVILTVSIIKGQAKTSY